MPRCVGPGPRPDTVRHPLTLDSIHAGCYGGGFVPPSPQDWTAIAQGDDAELIGQDATHIALSKMFGA